ncbi:MAG: beta-ketoacyl-[acyl-carrier-protein] synthase family protein [Allosphingosinicella sp.]
MRRVAVTGVGMVSAAGCGLAAGWAAARDGAHLLEARNFSRNETDCTVEVARVGKYDPEGHFEARRLPAIDPVAQYAIVAAREAVAQAGVSFADYEDERTRCIIGSGTGGECTHDEASYKVYGRNGTRLHPMTVPRIMLSAVPSQVALELQVRGGVYAVSSACASGAHAIGQAFQDIRLGQADIAIAGGSEACLTLGCVKGWQALHVLSDDRCRPFSRGRRGLVLGEGAAMFVLEEFESARRRGADILAEVSGFGMSSDAGSITAPDAGGMARAMRSALASAGAPADAVDHVNAHGTGTQANDQTEYQALVEVFGDRAHALPVTASKSVLGHALGASGAIEAAIAVETLRSGVLPPTANFVERDADCPLDCIPGDARDAPHVDLMLSNSFAFGGLNASIALQRA